MRNSGTPELYSNTRRSTLRMNERVSCLSQTILKLIILVSMQIRVLSQEADEKNHFNQKEGSVGSVPEL